MKRLSFSPEARIPLKSLVDVVESTELMFLVFLMICSVLGAGELDAQRRGRICGAVRADSRNHSKIWAMLRYLTMLTRFTRLCSQQSTVSISSYSKKRYPKIFCVESGLVSCHFKCIPPNKR